MSEMNDKEKEKIYTTANANLSSSLISNDFIAENIEMLRSLGDYKDSAELVRKYTEKTGKMISEQNSRDKERKRALVVQKIFLVAGALLVAALVFFAIIYVNMKGFL